MYELVKTHILTTFEPNIPAIMNTLTEINDFLQGTSFSNGLKIEYLSIINNKLSSRLNVILKECSGKNIIHIGCCDHIPLIETKIKQNRWLHGLLNDNCNRLIGIDNDAEAIEFTKKVSGMDNIIHSNIDLDEIPEIKAYKWDTMIFGEIVEHLDNPVSFLSLIHKRYKTSVDKILITVPNSLRIKNIKNTFKNREIINSDHRFEFTPYTLSKLVTLSGFKVVQIATALYDSPSDRGPINRFLLNRFPLLRDDIILIAEF